MRRMLMTVAPAGLPSLSPGGSITAGTVAGSTALTVWLSRYCLHFVLTSELSAAGSLWATGQVQQGV